MIDFFKPEDFVSADQLESFYWPDRAANIANAKLEKALGPKVYADEDKDAWMPEAGECDEFEAYLFDVKEIQNECEHEPMLMMPYDLEKSEIYYKCNKCNKRLIPENWKVKE